nr:flavodoxin-dependent (E)-4-hydroxy-3-methylbut-2-enyl-diphosphate synthase [uncultured Peptostreptococcus sp.]
MSYKRRKTRLVKVGGLDIGGDSPISVQSMTTTDTRDAQATINQIHKLEEVGCDLVRVAVVDIEAAKKISLIKKNINIPIVADIHFDHKLALEAINNKVDAIRINPGNIGSLAKTKEVVRACKDSNIPIRIGVNGGSLERDLLEQYGGPVSQAMVESAMRHVRILEALDFNDIVISLKNSDVIKTIEAYRLMSQTVDYPLHLGITEAGSIKMGTIKSAIGVGSLLADGIGDTIRISLTGDPTEEIPVAKNILRSLDLLNDKIKIVSCPTCGRCNINLIDLANEVEEKISSINKDITVAIMGCAVNGPGEAREADIGIAGGHKVGLLFKKGQIIKKIPQESIVDTLLDEINKLT